MKAKIFEPFSDFLFHEFFDRSIDARAHPEQIALACSIPIERLLFANQTHSKNIFILKKDEKNLSVPVSPIDDVDAFVTNRSGVFLMIRSADCQAVLMADPVTRTVAAVHSGWRGSVQNILGETISAMQREFGVDPKNLFVAFSASIGPCCQQFTDPVQELPPSFHRYILDGNRVDFWSASKDQLISAGVPVSHMSLPDECTSCLTDRFFSYRREKPETGRFASVIGLK